MQNVIFLLANPPSKWSKSQIFSRLRRARWSLIIMRNPESEIQMYRLLAFRKSSQMPMYRLLRGGHRALKRLILQSEVLKTLNSQIAPPPPGGDVDKNSDQC